MSMEKIYIDMYFPVALLLEKMGKKIFFVHEIDRTRMLISIMFYSLFSRHNETYTIANEYIYIEI